MKKIETTFPNLLGDNMKKRTLIVIALAIVLALSFATIATAKYAGYAYNFQQPDGTLNSSPGYLSWSGAQQIWGTDTAAQSLKGTAHGGYISTTVKCAVCHSVHRANSAVASSGTVDPTPGGAQNKLLASSAACVSCHTAWGSGSAVKKVEWGNADQGQAVGPHNSFNCTGACHGGGIHGGGGSTFHGMNVYMLGAGRDAALTTAFANGNGMDTLSQNWFVSGTDSPTSSGAYPLTIGSAANFAAPKATATGYVCAQSGCHTASQFAVNTWGFSENHGLDPAITSGATQTGAMTGHRSAPGSASNHVGNTCGPCHPGNPAGGYRTSVGPANFSANAFGCDQCHDMVGKATNSTAWPHGNRGVDVYEWDNTGAQTLVTGQASGNLWMYSNSIALATGTTGTAAKDPSFKVINNAAAFQGTTPAGKPGNINDGVCLKCHVAMDPQSLTAGGTSGYPATLRNHARPAAGDPLPSGYEGAELEQGFIYLYR